MIDVLEYVEDDYSVVMVGFGLLKLGGVLIVMVFVYFWLYFL